MVERGGLENRCGGNPTQGSNPCLSATNSLIHTKINDLFYKVFYYIKSEYTYQQSYQHFFFIVYYQYTIILSTRLETRCISY